MSPNEFVYWLQGWTEMEQGKRPNVEQWRMILSHLNLVFEKVTPEMEELMDGYPIGPAHEEDTSLELYDLVNQLKDKQDPTLFEPPQTNNPFPSPLDTGTRYCYQPPTHYCDEPPTHYCATAEGSQEPFQPTPPIVPRRARDD